MVGDLLDAASKLSPVKAQELFAQHCRLGQHVEIGLDRGAGIDWLEVSVGDPQAASADRFSVEGASLRGRDELGAEGPRVLVFFRAESQGYAFVTTVLAYTPESRMGRGRKPAIELRVPHSIHRFSRRVHIRVPLEGVPAMLSWVSDEAHGEPVTVEGRVQDVSVGGAAVTLSAVDEWLEDEFRRAPRLAVELELTRDCPLSLNASIAWLRVEPQPHRSMCLGLTWMDAPVDAVEAIGGLVVERRRDSLRGGLETVRSRGR